MTVYVDTMRARFGRMTMCHMIADSNAGLIAMADRIGVQRKWIQNAGTYREHFDIALSKRKLAIEAGAVEVSMVELGRILRARRMSGCKQIAGRPGSEVERDQLRGDDHVNVKGPQPVSRNGPAVRTGR
ncbi:DUF4031 domain-containing protein [Maritimibacter alexandrii]|uniref:DUF4031 domain-containing protein n=1 Tax=Maritimibacter alexandrii TaxID=2570355 RepID=UPI0011086FA2|nr:DUF4031 domain-containing protein [Maritimibacter alexandrii]